MTERALIWINRRCQAPAGIYCRRLTRNRKGAALVSFLAGEGTRGGIRGETIVLSKWSRVLAWLALRGPFRPVSDHGHIGPSMRMIALVEGFAMMLPCVSCAGERDGQIHRTRKYRSLPWHLERR